MTTKKEANELRLIAAQIIYKLWTLGEKTQLELLAMQAAEGVRRPYKQEVEATE